MDARVTKQRLATLLSYDWFKIIGAIAAAVTALIVFFTVISTRPTVAQKYDIYSYGGLIPATESDRLPDRLKERFSYQVLSVRSNNFQSGVLGDQAFIARRGVLEGSAMFVSAYSAEEDTPSPFEQVCAMGFSDSENRVKIFYDIPVLLQDARRYLAGYFGEDLNASDPDEAAVRQSFAEITAGDKRFKTDAQKEAGFALERERVIALRENYLRTQEAFDKGGLSLKYYRPEAEGEGCPVGISLGKLSRLRNLFYYRDSAGEEATTEVTLLLFDNNEDYEHTKYEGFALICYLLDTYEPSYS